MSKKKILIVINTMGRAGAETALIGLLKSIDPSEYTIDLLSIINRGELFTEVPDYVRILNHKIDSGSVLNTSGKIVIAKRILASFFYKNNKIRYPKKLIKDYFIQKKEGFVMWDKMFWRLLSDGIPKLDRKYDLAVAFLEGASTYYVADHVNAVKKCAFVHVDYEKAGYKRYMDQGCYNKMNRIFTVSQEVMTSFLNVYPEHKEKLTVFHNILDVDGIRIKAKESRGFHDNFHGIRIVTIGRLHYQKGYDIAIQAMKLLTEEKEDIRWYVLGEGSLKNDLLKQIEREGLKNKFILLGAVANPYPFLEQCDLYVHATRFEGKSIAIEEAQILGKAIVASKTTGAKEQIIDGEDGLLVDLTKEAIKEGILKMLRDKEFKQQCIRNEKEKSFHYEHEIKQILQLAGGKNG